MKLNNHHSESVNRRHRRRARVAGQSVSMALAGLVLASCLPNAAFAVDEPPAESAVEAEQTPGTTTASPEATKAPTSAPTTPNQPQSKKAAPQTVTTPSAAPAQAAATETVDLTQWGAVSGDQSTIDEAQLLAGRAEDEAAESSGGLRPMAYTPGKLDGSMLGGFAFNGLTARKLDAPLFAYVKKGEQIRVRFWAVAFGTTADLRPKVQMIRPDGVSVGTKNITRNQTTDQFSETATMDGVYKIVITDALPPAGKLRDVTPGEIKVSAAGANKPGRVWADRPSVDQSAIQNLSVYAMSPRGVTYQVTQRSYDGVSSALTMNNVGIHKGTRGSACVPAFQSIPEPLGTTGTAVGADKGLNPNGWLAPSTQADCKGLTGYRIFLEKPSTDIPATIANWADGKSRPAADKWGRVNYVAPKLQNLAVTRLAVGSSAARVSWTLTGQPGTVETWIDTNGNGRYDAGVDVKHDVDMLNPGAGSFQWDGKDATGAQVSVHQEVNFYANITKVSPIHFVREDVERAGGGLEIDAVAGGKVGPLKLNWDDSKFTSTSGSRTSKTPALKSPAGGQLSTGGVHGWKYNDTAGRDKITGDGSNVNTYPNRNDGTHGSWGDQRMINDWAYLDEQSAADATMVSLPREPELKIDKSQIGTPNYAEDRKTATITWSITVKNFGDGEATGVIVQDKYPEGVDPKTVKIVTPPTRGTFDTVTGKWDGFALAADDGTDANTATVQLSAVVPTAENFKTETRTNRAIVNAIGVPPVPIDGDCQVNDGVAADTDRCDEVPTPLEGPKPGWTMAKTSDPSAGIVEPGHDITYTLTAKNTGNVPMKDIVITDDLSKVLASAKLKGNAPEGTTKNGNMLTWKVPTIPVGGETEISYTVTVNSDAFLKVLENRAYGEQPEVPPADCKKTEPCTVEHKTPGKTAWTMEKTSDPASGLVSPGQDVTYTLTAKNTGDLPINGVVITDDMSKVLNHASFKSDAPEGTVRNGSTLTWSIPVLKAGETKKISYTVTVKKDAWLKTIENAAFGRSTTVPPADCVEDDPCVVDHHTPKQPVPPVKKTPPPALAITGGEDPLLLAAGGSILLLGAAVFGAIALRRRKLKEEHLHEA